MHAALYEEEIFIRTCLKGVDLFGQLPHLLANPIAPVGDGHVEAVVAAHLFVRPSPPFLKGGKEAFALQRDDKVHDHGGAPSQGGLCAHVKVVNSMCPKERHLTVRVGVDATGDDQLARCVHYPDATGDVQIQPHILDDSGE